MIRKSILAFISAIPSWGLFLLGGVLFSSSLIFGESAPGEKGSPAVETTQSTGKEAASAEKSEASNTTEAKKTAAEGPAESETKEEAKETAKEDPNAEKPHVASAEPVKVAHRSSNACLVNEAAIADVKRKQKEIDEKEKSLALKEADLLKREQVLMEEVKKLQLIRDEVAGLKEVNRKKHEEKVAKLVETFETMSPKSVARVLSQINEELAVDAMFRMQTPKLAKILNSMEPQKSTRLSELLTAYRPFNSSDSNVPNAPSEPRKPASEAKQ